MPTWVPNTNCILSIDNNAGTLTDQSDYVATVSQDISVSIGGFYTFGLEGQQRTEGQRNHTGNFTVKPATDVAGLHYQMLQVLLPGAGNSIGSLTMRIQYPDAAAGSFQLDQEVFISSYNLVNQQASGDGTPSDHQAQYLIDGEPTLTVIT